MFERRYDFIITNHARERFVERFSEENRKVYSHLNSCGGCQRCVSLIFKLKKEVEQNHHYLDKVICAKLHDARETKIHHNNNDFSARMMAKYGDRQAHYLISDDILFLVIDAEDGKICVTCMDAKDSILGDFVRRPKFKRKTIV